MMKQTLSVDLHLHSNNSCDSQTTIDEMCQTAIEKGFSVVCFTEHFDMNPKDEGYGYFNFDKYTHDINQARERYNERLTVLKGIEFSEPHLYPREFETMVNRDFDFVLASIHNLEGFGAYWSDPERLKPSYPVKRLFEVYYQEVLKAIRFGGFDSLAHIDYPKRYMPTRYEPISILDNIVDELVERDIALEINGYYSEVNPSNMICDLYEKHGGTIVTTGSDAHRCERIGYNFERVDEVIQHFNFNPVYFVQRKARPVL
ncbi:MAG: histidinol-phosphatase HisJ family protein [Dehalococcoidia bacterium]|nr:histidinol-phosphatase HisJ family protein [Dehalococcoidia bacterium]